MDGRAKSVRDIINEYYEGFRTIQLGYVTSRLVAGGWLKECRRIGTRYDKLAVSYLAMVKLACIRTYLPIAFSDRA